MVCDPDDYITVMGTCLEKNYFYRKILNAWVGEGLVTAPGEVLVTITYLTSWVVNRDRDADMLLDS